MSGPGYYPPTPGHGIPPGAPPAGQPQPKQVKRGMVIALAVVVGVFLATTGLFVALFLAAQGDTRTARDQLTSTEQTVVDARGRLDTAKSTVDGVKRENDDLTSRNAELHKCADPAQDLVRTAKAGDDAGLDKAAQEVIANC